MTAATPFRWRHVGLVAVGGAVGTAAREAAILLWPSVGGIPLAVLGVNLLGALLLGTLYSALGRRAQTERARAARALLGAGVLGGFTTYSALAGDTASLWQQSALLAAAYAGLSIVAGVAAAGLGLRLGAGRRTRSVGGRDDA